MLLDVAITARSVILRANSAEVGGARMTCGDFSKTVVPGEVFIGSTFEELKRLGNGKHDIRPKPHKS